MQDHSVPRPPLTAPRSPFEDFSSVGPLNISPETEEEAQSFLARHRRLVPIAILVALLLILFKVSGGETSTTSFTPNGGDFTVEAVVPLLALSKGESVEASVLRIVAIRKSTLSKAQLLQILRPEDLKSSSSKLVAKKMLPPQRVIFWKDLALDKDKLPAASTSPIFFSPGTEARP